ncbi:hypothetical protein KPH14_011079 [Odynerus spinipes]|uniref:Uncharacterized protein n=1 Tax=Odynerus spinipes TaxID=1348599 RepID=A0AAD9VM78_9HYME|nr:hypothetical protein KPH14_011079 [Odynerus spinipes]
MAVISLCFPYSPNDVYLFDTLTDKPPPAKTGKERRRPISLSLQRAHGASVTWPPPGRAANFCSLGPDEEIDLVEE